MIYILGWISQIYPLGLLHIVSRERVPINAHCMTYVVGIAEPRRQFGMTALHHGAVHGGADVLRALLDGKYWDKSYASVTYKTIYGILKDTQYIYAVQKIEQPVQYQVQDVEQPRLLTFTRAA